ncbi:MAG: DUF790 family protein [Sandaracinaceae bacterium]
MLSPDHVNARRRKGQLTLVTLKPDQAARALALAEQFHTLAESCVGGTRDALLESWRAVKVGARERKLADGLKKLIDDKLEFELALDTDPIALRRQVFELSTARRKALGEADRFDRDALIEEVAAEHGATVQALERGLYGDLKGAHVLREVKSPPPVALVRGYDLEQARAIMLRAAKVTAWVRGASPAAMRVLFRKLKFQRLLHTVTREPDGAFRIDIDGPFSLFESVTKYGLALAIALPAITACGKWELEADVRWGKKRDPLVFRLAGNARGEDAVPPRLPEEVEQLIERFNKRKSKWSASQADDLLELPGVGMSIPDLAFEHAGTGEVILLEVMGFWSRDAVWKRVELVEAGLEQKVLFAVSKRLRVSEDALGDDLPGSLYVYKGTMSAKQIEDKLNTLASR